MQTVLDFGDRVVQQYTAILTSPTTKVGICARRHPSRPVRGIAQDDRSPRANPLRVDYLVDCMRVCSH